MYETQSYINIFLYYSQFFDYFINGEIRYSNNLYMLYKFYNPNVLFFQILM